MENNIEVELERVAFDALANLLEGRRGDIDTVANSLGVTRADISRALFRSLSGRSQSLPFGHVLDRVGIDPKEFVAHASLFEGNLIPLLRQQAPELFGPHSPSIDIGAIAHSNPNTVSASLSRNLPKHAGTEVGSIVCRRYVLGSRLGKGGQAEVHRVFDLILGRPAAMKLFFSSRQRQSNRGIDHRIIREIEMLCGPASRTGVLRLLDWGCLGENPFFVFPICVSDLSNRLAAGKIDPEQAVKWTLQAAETLEELNRAGIVHADVKPHNLLLDQASQVLVADLGLASLAGDPEPEHLAGSYEYMSPEQFCIQPLNAQTDVYSLGITLYQLLAGRTPFKITGTDRDDVETLRRRVLFGTPPPLPASIPDSLRAICFKAIARDPADRFRSSADLAQALQKWLIPGWRRILNDITAWFRGTDSSHDPLRFPAEKSADNAEKWTPENLAESLRCLMLTTAEAGDWQRAISLITPALAEYGNKEDLPALAQFLWDACRVADRGNDRKRAISLACQSHAVYRQLGSPMEEIVSNIVAKWER